MHIASKSPSLRYTMAMVDILIKEVTSYSA